MPLTAMVNCFNMPKEFINETKKIPYVSPKFIEIHQMLYIH
jgi:hypothetical protein